MTIKNYIKPDDQVTLIFNRQARPGHADFQSAGKSDPGPPNSVVFERSQGCFEYLGPVQPQLADGSNHVANMQTNGVSKQLLVTTRNSNYQRMM
jgi:hypothetical protein